MCPTKTRMPVSMVGCSTRIPPVSTRSVAPVLFGSLAVAVMLVLVDKCDSHPMKWNHEQRLCGTGLAVYVQIRDANPPISVAARPLLSAVAGGCPSTQVPLERDAASLSGGR